MRVHEVMTSDVQRIAPGTPAETAWTMMQQQRLHHLVVTEGTRLVGVLSARDLGGQRGASVRQNTTVADLMVREVATVPPTATVRQAANVMRGRSIGCLVVTDAQRIVGIITITDLLNLLGQGQVRQVASTTRWTLKHRAPHRKRHVAAGSW